MTKLLVSDVHPLDDPAVYHVLYSASSVQRRARADSFRFEKDRKLSVGATALLDRGLSDYGFRENEMTYGYNAHGKPCFVNAPEIHFSISHSGTKVAVAFSDNEVGCDIEKVGIVDLEIARRFFSEREFRTLVAGNNADERICEFFRIWTMKESYMKASGFGFSIAPESFDVTGGAVEDFSLVEIDSVEGYRCALCYKADDAAPIVSTEVSMVL